MTSGSGCIEGVIPVINAILVKRVFKRIIAYITLLMLFYACIRVLLFLFDQGIYPN